jgi:hypothetical protein
VRPSSSMFDNRGFPPQLTCSGLTDPDRALPPQPPRPESSETLIARTKAAVSRGVAAVMSGPIGPPFPVPSSSSLKTTLDMSVDRAAIPIVPTLYPGEPSGPITVHNHITININGVDGREFTAKMDELLGHLRRSNEISDEVQEKLLAELTAGMAILKSPKPDPKMINLLLKRPLAFIGEKGAGTIIGSLATALLALLGRLTGLW